jgi:hypothetical protein
VQHEHLGAPVAATAAGVLLFRAITFWPAIMAAGEQP